jgi:hypothetical protein
MTAALEMLAPARRADVLAAVCALEYASAPVPLASFRALAEPALREAVEEVLAAAGRVLLTVGTGFLSGYDDRIAARLAEEGAGVLRLDDRAVLTLVLLFCVAIPRAEGRIPHEGSWTQAQPVPRTRLEKATQTTAWCRARSLTASPPLCPRGYSRNSSCWPSQRARSRNPSAVDGMRTAPQSLPRARA